MAKRRDPRISPEQAAMFRTLRTLGGGMFKDYSLGDSGLAKVIGILVQEHVPGAILEHLPDEARTTMDLRQIDRQWFVDKVEIPDFVALYLEAEALIDDFENAFRCMVQIVRRRTRMHIIKSRQPVPGGKSLGGDLLISSDGLPASVEMSRLSWSKREYNINNRRAQETGYLTEYILAAALGGSSVSAKNSPIINRGSGEKMSSRQVDCLLGNTAYEIKIRITNAASGKGRLGSEASFASDCRAAGFRPALVVLDDTPCETLDTMIASFERCGGVVYAGESAWDHIMESASPVMRHILQTYLKSSYDIARAFDGDLMTETRSLVPEGICISYYDNETGRAYQEFTPRHEAIA